MATVPDIPPPTIEDFYRAHGPAVRGFLISLSRDPHFADDLLQETFIKATRSLDGYRGGNPRSWLFTIARSVFIDAVRRTRAVPVEDVPDAGTSDPDAGERMLVGDVLDALPPRQRRAILLVDEAGLSYREAADVMGTSLGAMKVLLHRARSNFRSIYSETTDD